MDSISKYKYEGYKSYITIKKHFEEPERANIDVGCRNKCHKDAWNRGFMKALRDDQKRWKFKQRCEQ